MFVLHRMSSVRRSSIFDRPQLRTVTLRRSSDGYGLELQGSAPPVITQVCESVSPLSHAHSSTPT